MSLLEIQNDPDYLNANAATKQAIFDEYSKDDPDYTGANSATQAAIRESFGLSSSIATRKKEADPTAAIASQTAVSAARPVGTAVNELSKGGIRDLASIGKILYNEMTPGVAAHMFAHPVETLQKGVEAYVKGHPWANASLGKVVPAAGSAIVQGAIAPENLFMAPYNLAGYESEKIRANPTAPEYKTTPYAQAYRGEYATQGQAAAANRRNAIAGQQYGGLTPEEQAILAQDRARQLAPARNAIQGARRPNNWMDQALEMANRYSDVPRY